MRPPGTTGDTITGGGLVVPPPRLKSPKKPSMAEKRPKLGA